MQVRYLEEGWGKTGDGWMDGSGGVTYTSQGESPLVDLVCHVLNSWGMRCAVQRIAPGQRKSESAREVERGKNKPTT